MRCAQYILGLSVAFLLVKMCVTKITASTQQRRFRKPEKPIYPIEVHQMFRDKIENMRGPRTMGVWSKWDVWTTCSRSCGGGVTKQIRHCVTKPLPSKQHRLFKHRRRRQDRKITNHCVGLYKRIRLCNTQDCPNGIDYRLEQCIAFNHRPFKGKLYEWQPYLEAIEECALNCQAVGGGFYATLNNTVTDGTPCVRPVTFTGKPALPGTRGICVEGRCKSVGLDGIIGGVEDSSGSGSLPVGTAEDCAACAHGNCRSISGLYTRPDLPAGYSLVAQIPQGACRIMVQQLKHTRNVLGLRNGNNGSYILNGDWKFSNSRVVDDGAGTLFTYRKQDTSALETITSPGPLNNPVDVVIFFQQPNPGIKYGYALPVTDTPPSSLSPPSSHHPHHGGGDHGSPTLPKPVYRHHEAPTADIGIVEPPRRRADYYPGPPPPPSSVLVSTLSQKDEAARPVVVGGGGGPAVHPHRRQRPRRKLMWKVSGVSACSKSCGGGIQAHVVSCVREISQSTVVDRRCAHIEKPVIPPSPCNTQPCPTANAHWGGHWGVCVGTCGAGVQHYQIQCLQESSTGRMAQAPDTACLPPKPTQASRPCALSPCEDDDDNELPQHPEERARSGGTWYGDWSTGSWSQCSVSCGTGHRTRAVTCPSGFHCRPDSRPEHVEYCDTSGSCATGHGKTTTVSSQWLLTEWSTCSAHCGTGTQTRHGYCTSARQIGGSTTSGACGGDESAPELSRACSSDRQCGGQWFTGPWSPCLSDSCPSPPPSQSRSVLCIAHIRTAPHSPHITNDMTCSPADRPDSVRPCPSAPNTCAPRWFIGEWQLCDECSVTGGGGGGVQRRDVRCLRPNGEATELNSCDVESMPLVKRPCGCTKTANSDRDKVESATLAPALTADKSAGGSGVKAVQDEPVDRSCVDRIRNCYLAVQARLCQYPYYIAHCCTSCKRAQHDLQE